MSASNYLENLCIELLFRSGTIHQPTALKVALFLTMPGEDGVGGAEPSAPSYARADAGPGATYWSAPVSGDGTTTNDIAIIFPTPVEDWGTVLGYGIYDDLGNLLILDTLAVSKEILAGDPAPIFSPGALSIIVT
jgi:hypothetical protein